MKKLCTWIILLGPGRNSPATDPRSPETDPGRLKCITARCNGSEPSHLKCITAHCNGSEPSRPNQTVLPPDTADGIRGTRRIAK